MAVEFRRSTEFSLKKLASVFTASYQGYFIPLAVDESQLRYMFHPAGSNLTIAEAKRSRISAFGIEYEGKAGLSTSEFSWAA